jgi:hypothetical protein
LKRVSSRTMRFDSTTNHSRCRRSNVSTIRVSPSQSQRAASFYCIFDWQGGNSDG